MRTRALATAAMLAVVLMLTNSGCASFTAAREGASPTVVYYAALSDYVAAKSTAVGYAELPSTPRDEVLAIIQVVLEGDKVVVGIEALRQVGAVPDDKYTAASSMLSAAARLLQAQAAKAAAGEVTR